ncbi:MAG: hypothetical protein BHV72_13230 [Bacteroides sp. 43_46]|uniref:hypothetical protein n=1 Tax=Bacteroides sp. 43_46 TaxID=1897051 RepID=UPI000959D04A|nr:hypothetical protein [Bacteroides sp. 43_46]OKZ15898.1 MAG: hypothetical protein BHV72_13230 [Bacteroides sp. 43_46]
MDLIRATLKALFYDYPVENVVRLLQEQKENSFMDPFSHLVKWRETSFTFSEAESLKKLVQDEWMSHPNRQTEISKLNQCFLVLDYFSERVLDYDKKMPKVQFEHLFRWRELTLCLGEELFITAFLANRDIQSDCERHFFTWPNILPHNNWGINKILNEGLSDVHAHLGASADIFELSWLSLMNKVDGRGNEFNLLNETQENPVIIANGTSLCGMHKLCIAAAAIRVKLYQFLFKRYKLEQLNLPDVLRIITDPMFYSIEIKNIQADIDSLRSEALTLFALKENKPEYAIQKQFDIEKEDCDSIYMIHRGERVLLYTFFRRYYGGDKSPELETFIGYVYLYELIKIRFRRELVQTNRLIGFQNFKRYEARKSKLADTAFKNIYQPYAIQSSLRPNTADYLEVRIPPELRDIVRIPCFNKLFNASPRQLQEEREPIEKNDPNEKISFVVHFLKQEDKGYNQNSRPRHSTLRAKLKWDISQILEICRNKTLYSITGIDVAGSEFNCRPEVFAQAFRYARLQGFGNMTYHVGEDFYDLADGLRSIDDVLLFMEYTRGNRLGHALALGVDAATYYKKRHHTVVMPRQYLLDNLVWIYFKAMEYNIQIPPRMNLFIQDHCSELYNQIGYKKTFSLIHYRNSMYLRSDNLMNEGIDKMDYSSNWKKAQFCSDPKCMNARNDTEAGKIYQDYQLAAKIKDIGAKTCSCKLPEEFPDIISKIQECMMYEIEEKGIAIECNPSSNVMIGPFSKYEELPLLRFHQLEENLPDGNPHRLNVSINTDDKGIFATSLPNEYSLVAMALSKQKNQYGRRKWNDEKIANYLHKIMIHSKEQRFR